MIDRVKRLLGGGEGGAEVEAGHSNNRLLTGIASPPRRSEPVAPPPAAFELSEATLARLADLVAERLQHDALGDSLQRTVIEVSERLVREEIQRIRAAAPK